MVATGRDFSSQLRQAVTSLLNPGAPCGPFRPLESSPGNAGHLSHPKVSGGHPPPLTPPTHPACEAPVNKLTDLIGFNDPKLPALSAPKVSGRDPPPLTPPTHPVGEAPVNRLTDLIVFNDRKLAAQYAAGKIPMTTLFESYLDGDVDIADMDAFLEARRDLVRRR